MNIQVIAGIIGAFIAVYLINKFTNKDEGGQEDEEE